MWLAALNQISAVTGATGATGTVVKVTVQESDPGVNFQNLIAYLTLLTAIVAVYFTQRSWRHRLEPNLNPQISWEREGDTSTISLTLYNVGGGVAINTFYILVANGHRVMDHVGDGFIRPGDKVTLKTSIRAKSDAICMVQYQSADGHMWTASKGSERRTIVGPWTRRFKPSSWKTDALWAAHHPDRPYKGLPQATYELEWNRLGVPAAAPSAI